MLFCPLNNLFIFLYHADTIYEHEGVRWQKISNSATIKAGGKIAGTRVAHAHFVQGFVSPLQCISYWTIAVGSSFKCAYLFPLYPLSTAVVVNKSSSIDKTPN